MRTETEMIQLIINIAKDDPRIKAVWLNGSRANKNAPKDIFQDYDIVYVVSETQPFYQDEFWIDRFGPRLYMQMPEKMDFLRGKDYSFDDIYGWLIQFADGNRMDLHVESVAYAQKHIHDDKLCVVLLDKENILPFIPEATDVDYHVKKPTMNDFLCDCNNFWWCLNNVAKGLWREEIPYVMDMLNDCIRPHLVHVLSWKIGIETNFSCSVGKSGKYMNRYLSPEIWSRFLSTYPDADIEHIWNTTMIMCALFDEIASEVAERYQYSYDHAEAEASLNFLKHVRFLPKNAKEIYSSFA